MVARPLISIVDDDESVRESLPDLLKEFGFDAQAFSSAEEFLASVSGADTSCLVLDVAMPGMTGPDLQRELTRLEQRVPIVFITAHRDATERLRLIAHPRRYSPAHRIRRGYRVLLVTKANETLNTLSNDVK